MRRIGRIVTAAAVIAALAGSVPVGPADASTGALRDRHAMLHATNISRDRFSLAGVWINRTMSQVARQHSLAMAQSQTLFHTSDPARAYLKGIRWNYWGENVGVTGGNVSDLEQAFMASTSHRQNILNRSFRHVAIGAVRVDGVLWVTVFFYG